MKLQDANHILYIDRARNNALVGQPNLGRAYRQKELKTPFLHWGQAQRLKEHDFAWSQHTPQFDVPNLLLLIPEFRAF